MRALLLAAAISMIALGCDDRPRQTTTTGASGTTSTTATDDLKQAGRDLGSAAQKAAGQTGRAVAAEAKREARDLDVKITTSVDAGR